MYQGRKCRDIENRKVLFFTNVADCWSELSCLERLPISAQYRVRIPQSRKDICRRF